MEREQEHLHEQEDQQQVNVQQDQNSSSSGGDDNNGGDGGSGGGNGGGSGGGGGNGGDGGSGYNLNFGALSINAAPDLSQISAHLNVFGNNNPLEGLTGTVGTDGTYSISYTGALPLEGSLGGVTLAGVYANKIEVNQDGLQTLDISAGSLAIGEYITLTNLRAVLTGSNPNFEVTAASASGKLAGQEFTLTSPSVVITRGGALQSMTFGAFQSGDVTAQGITWDGTSITIASAGISLPEIMNQTLMAEFQTVNVNTEQGSLTGVGTIKQDSTLSVLNNTLHASQFSGQVELKENNQWVADVLGTLTYTQPNIGLEGSGHYQIGSDGTSSFNISDGRAIASLNGINVIGEGIEYDSTTDVLKVISGNIDIPAFGSELEGNITNATISGEGFDFESISMSAAEGIELFPGFKVVIPLAQLSKEGGTYTFTLEEGELNIEAAGAEGSGKVSMTYNDAQGINGSVNDLHISTPFADVDGTGAITFDQNSLSLESATFKIKNMGPDSENLEVTTTGAAYTSEGLSIDTLDVTLPEIGELKLKASFSSIHVGSSGVSGDGVITSTDGNWSFGQGALSITQPTGLVSLSEGGWNINVTASLRTEVPNVEAQGDVALTYDAQNGLAFNVASGSLNMDIAGVSITSTGITYDSGEFSLGIAETTVNLPEFQGSELTANLNDVRFTREGFDFQNLVIQSSGAMELMPGLTVSNLRGELQKESDVYKVILDGDIALSGAVEGTADGVHLEYSEGSSQITVKNFNISTSLFEISAGDIEYAEGTLAIDSSTLKVKNLGPGSDSLEVTAQGIAYNSEGLTVTTLNVKLPQIGDLNVSASLAGIKATGQGLTIDSGTISATGEVSFLNGALKVDQIQGTVNANQEGWGLDVQGQLGVDVDRTTAEGGVRVVYSNDAAPTLEITDGKLNTSLLGIDIKATGIQYNNEDDARLELTEVKIDLPEFANSELQTTVNNASFGPDGFDFENITITSNGNMELLPGLVISGLTGQINKEGENYALLLDANAQFQNSVLQGGAEGVHLEYREGSSTFQINNITASTNFFEMTVNSATYSSGALSMDQANFKAKGLGPASDSLEVNTTGIQYTSQGFSAQEIKVKLPQVGDVDVEATVTNLAINNTGISVGGVAIAASGDISFAQGKLKVQNLQGAANISGDGKWDLSIGGQLAANMEGLTAEGNLNVEYNEQDGVKLDVQNGNIRAEYGGVIITATGLSYDTENNALVVDNASVDIPELQGGAEGGGGITASVQGVRFGPNGFEIDGVSIASTGVLTLFPGVTVSNLAGSFSRSGNGYAVHMEGGANVTTGLIQGGAQKAIYDYNNGVSSFSFEGLNIQTEVFDFTVDQAAYSEETFSVSRANLQLKNVGPLNGAESSAENITYNKDGLQVGSLSAQFPPIQDVGVSANVANLVVPSEGSISADATISVSTPEISLAGGAVKVNNIAGTASIRENRWAVGISASLAANFRGIRGSGDVTISYDSNEGPNVEISNGDLSGSYMGIRVSGDGMSYNMRRNEIGIDRAELDLPQFGNSSSNISSSISDLSIRNGDFNFSNITVNLNQSFELFPGFTTELKSGTLNKQGRNLKLGVGVGVALDTQLLDGTAEGNIEYDIESKEFSGHLTRLNVDTGVFDFDLSNGMSFSQHGIYISSAQLQFSDSMDVERLKRMIPKARAIPEAVFTALKGIQIDATDIYINRSKGIEVGDWNLSVLKIPIELEKLGLSGEINPVDGTGNLEGSRSFDVAEMGVPTRVGMTIPIVGPVSATARLGIDARASVSGRIAVDKNGENFVLSGGLGFDGYVGVYAEILAGVDVGIASARIGAGARFGLDFDGFAGLETEVAYNPEASNITDKLEPQGGIKFGYFFDANLISAIYLVLEAEVLWGLWGSRTTWDLAEWTLGSLLMSGASQGNSFGDLFSNMNNHIAFADKEGGTHNLSGGPVQLPTSVEGRRRQQNQSTISRMRSVAAREEPDD